MEFKEAIPFVVAAYLGVWAVLFAVVLVMNGRISSMVKEIDLLSKALEKKKAAKAEGNGGKSGAVLEEQTQKV